MNLAKLPSPCWTWSMTWFRRSSGRHCAVVKSFVDHEFANRSFAALGAVHQGLRAGNGGVHLVVERLIVNQFADGPLAGLDLRGDVIELGGKGIEVHDDLLVFCMTAATSAFSAVLTAPPSAIISCAGVPRVMFT